MDNEKVPPGPSLRAARMSTIKPDLPYIVGGCATLPANVYETLVLPSAPSVNALPVMNACLRARNKTFNK